MKIPCKDCIVFPMCKARYINYIDTRRLINYSGMIPSCELFANWFDKASLNDLREIEKLFEAVSWIL